MLHNSQNLYDYLSPDLLQDIDAIIHDPKNQATDYLAHYFSPWTQQKMILVDTEIRQILLNMITHHTKNPGYALTRKRHDSEWMASIARSAQLDKFPNISQPGIALTDVEARLLPTAAPSFKNIHSEWDGYPFDQIQQSYLPKGTPLRILHATEDHAWHLILAAGFFGWVKSEATAFVSDRFMHTYQTAEHVVPLYDQIVATDDLRQPPIALRIGNLYPISSKNKRSFTVIIPRVDEHRNAIMQMRDIPHDYLSLFPYSLTMEHIAEIGNRMMGNPYGWGGMCGYRDCSSTLADLMTTFGMWLPRNSAAQIALGTATNLKEMSIEKKLLILNKINSKFTTLCYFPGHVMLYLGEKNGVPYAYQSAGRYYGTVITPLHLKPEGATKTLLEQLEQARSLL